ncbi:peroxiredoxin [Candidatus Woesearchaeota archaeon]|nr:peroxiredoxin [Candidatus Woesearchaeota archaeon]
MEQCCCQVAKVGEKAPEFSAEAYVHGQFKKVGLKDYKGKWVLLFFYPLDFTFVCPTEIKGFASKEKEFDKLNCKVLACSTDSVHSHKAWFGRDMPEVKFPILSDMNHAISSAYDVLLEEKGIALRGTFIIDPDGILQHMVISSLNVGRSVDETLRVLQALQTGGLCPIEWKPGQPTLKV